MILGKHLYNVINSFCSLLGYNVTFKKKSLKIKNVDNSKTLINIGSGDWECSGWINLDYPNENYKDVQRKHKIVPYDIRNDKIPFDDNSVDLVYSSHVIEHIETPFVQKMFDEVYRVLKYGGGY